MAQSGIWVISQFPALASHIKALLPDEPIREVKLSGMKERFLWNLKVTPEEKDQLKDAQIIVTDNNICGQLLYSLPSAKWVQCTFTGVDYIFNCLDPNKRPSFTVTRYAGGAQSDLVAEYVLGQVICWERNFFQLWDRQKEKSWKQLSSFDEFKEYRAPTIRSRCFTILGVGNMGKEVAKALKQRGATVIGFARQSRKPPEDFDRLETNLAAALSDCNYICNTLPSTPGTESLLDGTVLSHCKKKPVFINVGRGDVITEQSLLQALKEQWISGAVLDVFKPEPLSVDSKLWNTPNVVITPHVGAIADAGDIAICVAENYRRYITGQKLLYAVDWDLGY